MHSLEKPHIIDAHASFAVLRLAFNVHTLHNERSEALRAVYTEMLMAGCGKYTRATFLDALAQHGITFSLDIEDDAVFVVLRARNEALTKALSIFSAVFEKPHFKASELARIKKQLIAQLTLAKEDPRGRAVQLFLSTLLPKTDRRYEYDIDTVQREIQKVGIPDIRSFHTTLRRAPAFYACGGTEQACGAINKALARIKINLAPKDTPGASLKESFNTITKSTVHLLDIPHRSNIEFEIGGPLPILRTDSEYAALAFGMCVLGIRGGFTGRLMSIVREKEGLTYSIYAQLVGILPHQYGFWNIETFFAPKDAVRGITSTLREVERIRDTGITNDELVRFKQILRTRFAMTNDSLLKRVGERFSMQPLGLTPDTQIAYRKSIENLTRAQVNTALKKFLNTSHMIITGAGPVASVRHELQKFQGKKEVFTKPI